MEKDLKNLVVGVVSGILSGIAVYSSLLPKGAYPTGDLNKDGIADLVIEQRCGRKVPMYGTKNGDYLTGEEMLKLNPESVIDYKKIWREFNK